MIIVQRLHLGQGKGPAIGSTRQSPYSERAIRMVGKTSAEPHSVQFGKGEE